MKQVSPYRLTVEDQAAVEFIKRRPESSMTTAYAPGKMRAHDFADAELMATFEKTSDRIRTGAGARARRAFINCEEPNMRRDERGQCACGCGKYVPCATPPSTSPLQIAEEALAHIAFNGDALSGDECAEIAEEAMTEIYVLWVAQQRRAEEQRQRTERDMQRAVLKDRADNAEAEAQEKPDDEYLQLKADSAAAMLTDFDAESSFN